MILKFIFMLVYLSNFYYFVILFRISIHIKRYCFFLPWDVAWKFFLYSFFTWFHFVLHVCLSLNIRDVNSFLCTILFISHGNKRIRRVTEGILSFFLMLSHPFRIVIKSVATKVNIAYSFVDVFCLGVVLFVAH